MQKKIRGRPHKGKIKSHNKVKGLIKPYLWILWPYSQGKYIIMPIDENLHYQTCFVGYFCLKRLKN
jgi:hypothetical protein